MAQVIITLRISIKVIDLHNRLAFFFRLMVSAINSVKSVRIFFKRNDLLLCHIINPEEYTMRKILKICSHVEEKHFRILLTENQQSTSHCLTVIFLSGHMRRQLSALKMNAVLYIDACRKEHHDYNNNTC